MKNLLFSFLRKYRIYIMKRETEQRAEEKYVLLRSGGQMFNILCCQTVNNIDQVNSCFRLTIYQQREDTLCVYICISGIKM